MTRCQRKRILFLTIGLAFSHWASALESPSAVYSSEAVTPYPAVKSGGNYLFNYYLPPASNSSPWWVSWAPNGAALYFSMHGSLWKVDTHGGAATEIKGSSEYLSSPTVSPDGRYLAYTSEKNGRSINLRILDLETGRDVSVTDDEHITLDPSWSPDGRRLAFVSTRQDGHFHIFVTKIRNGESRGVTSVTHVPGSDNIDPTTGRTGMHTSPTWTVDGKQLIFVWNRGAEQGSGGLWVMDAIKYGIRRATLVHQEESVYRLRPDVSPDGSRIVYSSYAGEQFNNLYLLPLAGGVPYKLSLDSSDRFYPRWSPDGRRIAYLSNRGGTSALRIQDVFSGADVAVNITGLDWMQPRARLRVRTVDADSGATVGARIYLRASDGKSYAPNDEYHRVARRLGEHYFHSRGTFDLELPAGPVELEAHRGFEYYPVAKQIDLTADEEKTITFTLRRMHDSSSDGWYGGDNHVHMNYAGNLHNSPANLVAMADAEGVALVNALVANKYTRTIDHQYFTGKPHEASTEDTILVFNEEYRPPFYGHVSLLGLKDHLIVPFAAGLNGTAIESLYPSNTDVLQLAAQQDALGGYVHPFRGPADPILDGLGGAKAFPIDLALGTLGFHELTSQASWGAYKVWHHALSAGFRVPIVGGEDAITDLHRMYVLGQLRTYADLAGELSWENWLNAIRRGSTVVSNGPLLSLTVDGAGPGEERHLDGPGTVHIKGSVQSIVPVDNIEILVNGETVSVCASTCARDPNGPGTRVEFETEILLEESSWITLQAYTDGPVHPVDDHFVQATTNAVWTTVGDQPIRKTESILYFRRWIHELSALLNKRSEWRSDDEKQDVLNKFRAADDVFAQRLREARLRCAGNGIGTQSLVALDRKLRSYNEAANSAIQYGVLLEDACNGRIYSVGDDMVIPAAGSVKAALLIEFFAKFADQLDVPFELTESVLLDRDSPAIQYFHSKTLRGIRDDLVGLSAREIGEAMINKSHVSSSASYNAAANVVILALGGPANATQKIRDRHAGVHKLTISRYMLADRHEVGDNVTTLNDLAAIQRSLAMRDVPDVDARTLESIRSVLDIDADDGKGESSSPDPQAHIAAGWLQRDDEILVYAIAAHRVSPADRRDAELAVLRSQVSELSEIVKSAH